MSILSSANHYIQLLKDKDFSLNCLALDKLLLLTETLWPQISENLPLLESLFEQESFPRKDKAAFLISKIYYHLEEYDESVEYALEAGDLFDVSLKNTFEECIVSKGLQKYIQLQQQIYEGQEEQVDQKLENFFSRIFQKALDQKNFKNTLGICLEARRLDKIQLIMKKNDNVDLINYLYELTIKHIQSRKFRLQVLEFISSIYKMKKLESQDYIYFAQCSYHLNEYKQVASVLSDLILTEKQNLVLLAFQIGQDINDNENKFFTEKVIENLNSNNQNYNNLVKILNGSFSQEQSIKFLIQNNKSDYQSIIQIKDKIDQKQSVSHSAVIFANSLMQAGTTDDKFIRDNLEWVSKSTHWAKFNLIASMGVIHQNNHSQAMTLLKPYLPGQAQPNYYAHGGSMMALGLIFQKTKDQNTLQYIIEQIKNVQNNQNEIIIHGCCLALGLVAMGSEDLIVYEELKNVLFTNQAVTGEAAAMGIGLLMAGTGSMEVFEQLFQYATETQHEKIIRALSLASAALFFQKEEQADKAIQQMLNEQDQIIRYGGVQTIGMAYCGTSNPKAIKQLLHIISTDVSDDVKRAAVISLGFVFINNISQLPQILSLLIISYNPYVRYGTAIALGIAGAGKGNQEALKMLEPMLNDNTDFVRQGAMIATSLILQQTNEQMDPFVTKFKKEIQDVYQKKTEGVSCKLGAILSCGIISTGGRNSVVQLTSKSGNLKMGSCIGVLYFTHYWYWFSSIHFLSLGLQPSALIGVDKDLDVPCQFQFQSNNKYSLFGYPKQIQNLNNTADKKESKVQLSTTVRLNKRAIGRKKDEIVQETEVEEKKDEIIQEEEPNVTLLNNPSRVLEKQQSYIKFIENRYKPILKNRTKGIVFLVDTQPDEKKQKIEEEVIQEKMEVEPQQVQPPEEFIFDESETQKLL